MISGFNKMFKCNISAQCVSGSFLDKTLLQQSLWDSSLPFTAVPMSVSETVIPQCFAKAGKMEPNHLLNGFGPLQPAVAMLWWLQELLLLFDAFDKITVMAAGHSLMMTGLWASFYLQHLECSVIVMFNAVSFLTNKETDPSFKTLVWSTFPDWVLPLCLQRDWYSDHTISNCFKNSRGWMCSVRYFRNTALTCLYGCLAKTPPKLTVTGCQQSITLWVGIGKGRKNIMETECSSAGVQERCKEI